MEARKNFLFDQMECFFAFKEVSKKVILLRLIQKINECEKMVNILIMMGRVQYSIYEAIRWCMNFYLMKIIRLIYSFLILIIFCKNEKLRI